MMMLKLELLQAHTPPSSWYTSSDVWEFEKQTVFARNWVVSLLPHLMIASRRGSGWCRVQNTVQAVGHTGKLQKSGDFITGTFAGTSYVVVKGEDGNLRAFYNVRTNTCSRHFPQSCLTLLIIASVVSSPPPAGGKA